MKERAGTRIMVYSQCPVSNHLSSVLVIFVILSVAFSLFISNCRNSEKGKVFEEPSPTSVPLPTPTPSVFYITDDIIPPEELRRVDPVYPEKAWKAHRGGLVILSVIVTVEGAVTSIESIHSAGDDLEQAAIAAVRQWRYKPAMRDGKPVAVYYNLTIRFSREITDQAHQ